MRIWKLIAHHDDPAEAFQASITRETIAVGWNNVGDLEARRPASSADIGKWIRDSHPNLTNSNTGGPSLWNFYSEMSEGDLVIVGGQGNLRGVFLVTGPYAYREVSTWHFGYAHVRRARLIGLDARELWAACGGRVGAGQTNQWSVARCETTPAAQKLIQVFQALDLASHQQGVRTDDVPNAPTDWAEWAKAKEVSLPDWKSASKGLAKRFRSHDESAKIRKESAYASSDSYWVEVHLPLPGVHLIAFQLLRSDLRTKVSLRVWVDDKNPDVYRRFASAPAFGRQWPSVSRWIDRAAPDTFKADLASRGISVTGVHHNVELAPLGAPSAHVLSSLFEAFCVYAADCHCGIATPEDQESSSEPGGSNEQQWQEDENALAEIEGLDLDATEKLALVKARVNQSGYRRRLMDRWGQKCSVTSIEHCDLLIASHIVPWSQCATAQDRWSPDNGLLLPPGLDKAFELGVIGFDDRGQLVLSQRGLHTDVQRALGIVPGERIRDFDQYPGLIPYLARHRAIHAETLLNGD